MSQERFVAGISKSVTPAAERTINGTRQTVSIMIAGFHLILPSLLIPLKNVFLFSTLVTAISHLFINRNSEMRRWCEEKMKIL